MLSYPRCSVFLLDSHTGELVAKVFDSRLPDKQLIIRIKVGQGIAGYVAQTGTVVYHYAHVFTLLAITQGGPQVG